VSVFFRKGEQRAMDASWFGTDPDRPASVTAENAQTLAPVFAAHRHIVDFISTLPIDSYRYSSGGSRTPINLPYLLSSQNALGRPGADQWCGQAAFGMASVGNAVGWVVEANLSTGRPDVVSWLGYGDWSFDERTKKWSVYGVEVPSSRIVHIPWIVPPGRTLGLSPIEHYATIVRAGLSAQEYSDVKRGGGIPPVHLKNAELVLDSEKSANISDRASRSFASGKPLVTGKDWDLNLLTIPPNHAQFIETLKLSANQIAAIYGIDPREIGGSASESLTYATDESRSLNRANNMRPYIVRLEKALSRILAPGEYIKFNVDATIRTDIKTRTEVVGEQIKDGRMSVNEARALDDKTPVPGGDFYNVPAPSVAPNTRNGETP
jgi:HK97 family phage portal protein